MSRLADTAGVGHLFEGVSVDHLVVGAIEQRAKVLEQEREFFTNLAKGQSPSALFISCSDSRIDPNFIFQAPPGDLFALRNAGNIVPPYGASTGGEGASVEFAVSALNVKDIIVCGHSQCGAMKAMLNPASTDDLPAVRSWLKHAEATRRIVAENYKHLSGEALLTTAIEQHVLIQLENLQTHPAVAVCLQRGDLRLHAWVYRLETGEILSYDTNSKTFEPLSPSHKSVAKSKRTKATAPKKKASRK